MIDSDIILELALHTRESLKVQSSYSPSPPCQVAEMEVYPAYSKNDGFFVLCTDNIGLLRPVAVTRGVRRCWYGLFNTNSI